MVVALNLVPEVPNQTLQINCHLPGTFYSGTFYKRVVGLAPEQPDWRVLIVDDMDTNRSLLIHLLSPIGFKIQEAKDGQDAIALWKTWKPHAILMDLRMPVMDGYEATRLIRSTNQGKDTVIIAVTAEDYSQKARSTGFDDYILKPYSIKNILSTLSTHLSAQYVYHEFAS